MEAVKTQISEEQIFTIIASAGEANGLVQEAFMLTQESKYEEAKEKLEEANKALLEAHHVQTQLINNEVQGNKTEIGILMVHAQDHLMNVVLAKQLIQNMMKMQEEINNLKSK